MGIVYVLIIWLIGSVGAFFSIIEHFDTKWGKDKYCLIEIWFPLIVSVIFSYIALFSSIVSIIIVDSDNKLNGK